MCINFSEQLASDVKQVKRLSIVTGVRVPGNCLTILSLHTYLTSASMSD